MINKVNCLIFDDHPMVCFAIKTLIFQTVMDLTS